MSGGVLSLLARRTEEQDGHLLWTGPTMHDGHPGISTGRTWMRAGELAWEVESGASLSDGLQVVPTCGESLCVAPAHLATRPGWGVLDEIAFMACSRAASQVARREAGFDDRDLAVDEDDLYQQAVLYYVEHPEEMSRSREAGAALPGVEGGDTGAVAFVQNQIALRLGERLTRERGARA